MVSRIETISSWNRLRFRRLESLRFWSPAVDFDCPIDQSRKCLCDKKAANAFLAIQGRWLKRQSWIRSSSGPHGFLLRLALWEDLGVVLCVECNEANLAILARKLLARECKLRCITTVLPGVKPFLGRSWETETRKGRLSRDSGWSGTLPGYTFCVWRALNAEHDIQLDK